MTPNRGFRTAPLNNLRGRPGEANQQPCSQEQILSSSGLWPPCRDLRRLSIPSALPLMRSIGKLGARG